MKDKYIDRAKKLSRKEAEEYLNKAKAAYALIKANPDKFPHVIELPDGSRVDILDGETEKLFDEIDFIIHHPLNRTRQ